MEQVYLLFGSNLGNSQKVISKAVKAVENACGKLLKLSAPYQTEAWGLKEQNSFINLAGIFETTLEPTVLLKTLKAIEQQAGRVESVKWGPRVLDIDILFYGNNQVNLPDLKIPHPYIHQRMFTLVPLNEIAPYFKHPSSGKTINQLLRACTDNSNVKKI